MPYWESDIFYLCEVYNRRISGGLLDVPANSDLSHRDEVGVDAGFADDCFRPTQRDPKKYPCASILLRQGWFADKESIFNAAVIGVFLALSFAACDNVIDLALLLRLDALLDEDVRDGDADDNGEDDGNAVHAKPQSF